MNIRYGMLSNNVAKKEMLFFEAKDILKRIILCIFSCEKKAKIAPVIIPSIKLKNISFKKQSHILLLLCPNDNNTPTSILNVTNCIIIHAIVNIIEEINTI